MSSDLVKRLCDGWSSELRHAAIAHIKALEGEVADANLIAKEQTQLAMNAKLALAEAEARAERLRVALIQFNNHFGPLADNVVLHPEARKCFHLARKALEDKQ